MKEMVYQSSRKIELLDSGEIKRFKYYIVNLGTHPTAYIEIPKEHKYFNVKYNDVEVKCHWGLTYSESYLNTGKKDEIKDSWFIGWDYAHCSDYCGHNLLGYGGFLGKKWATEEILQEVKNVIEQLIENGGNENV